MESPLILGMGKISLTPEQENLTRPRLKNWHISLVGRSGIESYGSFLRKPLPSSNSSV